MADNTQTTDTTLQGGIAAIADQNTTSNIAVFYFDIVNEHSITVQNQITDNYVENNTAIQDHIAHSPIEITLSGLSGEKVFTPSSQAVANLLDTAKQYTQPGVFDKLHSLELLLPPVSNLEQIAQNTAQLITSSVQRYIGIFDAVRYGNTNNPLNTFNGLTGEAKNTRLEEIYAKVLALRTNNTEMIVDTPYKRFDRMYIQSISLRQGEENYVTDISITFKQLNFASTKTTAADQEVMAKCNAWARAKEENHGLTQGKKKSIGAQAFDGDKVTL